MNTTTTNDVAIEYRDICKSYGEKNVLEHLNLKIPRGEFVTMIGSSGSGKTTALKMVNRLIEPTSGEVLVDGRNVRDADPIQLRRNIGYAIQGSVLFPHMTVEDNISYVPNLLNKRDHERTRKAVRTWTAAARGHRTGPCRVARHPSDGRAVRRRGRDHPRAAAG